MRDYTVNFNPQTLDLGYQNSPKLKRNKKRFYSLIFSLLFLVVISWIIKSGIISKLINTPKNLLGTSTERKREDLINQINSITLANGGTYSIFIYNLNTGEEVGINEKMVITAASVNKLPIFASLYHLASEGSIDLERQIKLQEDDVSDYGTGSIRYDPIGSSYSLKTLARLMMEKSDNTAAHILGTIVISKDKIQEMITSWGLTQTDMVNNKTSSYDMYILLTKIYKGEIANKAYTEEMLEFLRGSDFEDRIPTGVPKDIKVYHKTGDDIGKIHDAALVDLPNNPYYIGILTTDLTDEKKTEKSMAQISRLVYEYMKD